MKVLITGAAGFIGSFLARELLSRGDNVVGIDNFSDYYSREAKEFNLDLIRIKVGQESVHEIKTVQKILKELEKYHDNTDSKPATALGTFKFYEEDIRNQEEIEKIIAEEKVDSIIHLAAAAGVPYSLKDPLLYSTSNLDGTVILLEAARLNNVTKFVFASSSSVYGDTDKAPTSEEDEVNKPISVYAASKRSGELLCYTYNHLYGINIIAARIFGPIYGPLQRPYGMASQKFIRQIYHDLPITIYGDGSMKRDCTYIDDEVDGLIKCLDADMSKFPSHLRRKVLK